MLGVNGGVGGVCVVGFREGSGAQRSGLPAANRCGWEVVGKEELSVVLMILGGSD